MTASRPDVLPFGLYTGREAARHLKVDRHTITRWKRQLKLVPHTNDGRYLGKDIIKAWQGKI